VLELISELGEIWRKGGFVMPFLVGSAAMMWYGILYRMVAVRRGSRLPVDELVAQARAGELGESWGVLDEAAKRAVLLHSHDAKKLRLALEVSFGDLRERLNNFASLVKGVALVAPLAGLLGTVTGMIETFDHLGSMTLSAIGGGGMGAGISEALVSTQTGLVVAVPGILLGAMLNRRQQRLEEELDQIAEMVSVRELEA
jgi:biopolymer transport protein ExbB